jgi:hypothetical protein
MRTKEWRKVNVRGSRVESLQEVSSRIKWSIPQCLDEAIELWIRDVASKRIELAESITEKR